MINLRNSEPNLLKIEKKHYKGITDGIMMLCMRIKC